MISGTGDCIIHLLEFSCRDDTFTLFNHESLGVTEHFYSPYQQDAEDQALRLTKKLFRGIFHLYEELNPHVFFNYQIILQTLRFALPMLAFGFLLLCCITITPQV
jgi:hypothetical protein